jgi:hypothetical protein
MGKYFVLGGKKELASETIVQIEKEGQDLLKTTDQIRDENAARQLAEEDNLVHADGRVVVKLDMHNKYFWTFSNGTKIRYERNFNEFNRRKTQPVNCTVISGDGIPKGAEMLVDHNAFHESNRINDYKNSFETDGSDRVRYFALQTYECYAWREGKGEWKPIPPFQFGLRVFKPYKGLLQNIEPEVLKDTLYVTSGELAGNVVKTLKGCDYQIIFANDEGTESYLIVFRPMGDLKRNMEEEAIAILGDETELVKSGEYLVGYELSDAKKLNDAN